MKRIVFMMMVVMVALGAAASDRFYIEDFTIAPGETKTVSILLDNETAYTAFQSDLYLSEGLTASNFALTGRKNSNHTFTATVLPDGGIRLLSYSLKLKTYSGNSGALVTFDVTAGDGFAGNATIVLRETVFTTAAGVEVPFDDETCRVEPPAMVIPGDVNGDNDVTIADVSALIDMLLDNGPYSPGADVNGDNDVTIADVSALIDILLGNV